jgi:parvulin-like peptidyl-prolyl isomerase
MKAIIPKSVITVIPWVCFLGVAALSVSLFLESDFKPSNPDSLKVVTVSREQVDRSLYAVIAENPKLKDESEQLKNEMKRGAEAQSLLVAEAFRQGLAESDYIVRNRLAEIQVMVLYEKADTHVTPDAVNNYFSENRKRYVRNPKRNYIHLFVPITNQVNSDTAKQLLENLFNSDDFDEKNKWVTKDQLRKSWGPNLANQVFEMPTIQWSQPIPTKLGWHRIKVLDEAPEGLYEFEEIKTKVTEDFRRHIRKKLYDAEIERLKKLYKIKWTD